MIDDSYTVEAANWARDRAELEAVRERVFIQEQSVPVADEWDDFDATSFHVLARDGAGNAIGTGRLTPERMIGRMAVLADWRGRGVGETMLERLIEQARSHAWEEVALNAQVVAIPFYERAGFAAEGPEFLDAGIVHRLMRKKLSLPEAPPRAGPTPSPDARPLRAETQAEAQDCVLRVAEGARHRLWLYTRTLEPALHEREPFLAEIKRIALSGRAAEIRILIRSPGELSHDRHPLISLAQRMPSFIAVRSPVGDEDKQYPSAFVLNDTGGYFFRVLAGRPEGEGSTRAPGRQNELRELFESVWRRSEPDPEFRRLTL